MLKMLCFEQSFCYFCAKPKENIMGFLVFDSNIPSVAERDVECFKVVVKQKEEGTYLSPYMKHSYKLGETIVPNQDDIEPFKTNLKTEDVYIVEGGFLYSFSNIEIARFKAEENTKKNPVVNYAILKCLIPKGTSYYTDLFCQEYASKKLFVVGEVSLRPSAEEREKSRQKDEIRSRWKRFIFSKLKKATA